MDYASRSVFISGTQCYLLAFACSSEGALGRRPPASTSSAPKASGSEWTGTSRHTGSTDSRGTAGRVWFCTVTAHASSSGVRARRGRTHMWAHTSSFAFWPNFCRVLSWSWACSPWIGCVHCLWMRRGCCRCWSCGSTVGTGDFHLYRQIRFASFHYFAKLPKTFLIRDGLSEIYSNIESNPWHSQSARRRSPGCLDGYQISMRSHWRCWTKSQSNCAIVSRSRLWWLWHLTKPLRWGRRARHSEKYLPVLEWLAPWRYPFGCPVADRTLSRPCPPATPPPACSL